MYKYIYVLGLSARFAHAQALPFCVAADGDGDFTSPFPGSRLSHMYVAIWAQPVPFVWRAAAARASAKWRC